MRTVVARCAPLPPGSPSRPCCRRPLRCPARCCGHAPSNCGTGISRTVRRLAVATGTVPPSTARSSTWGTGSGCPGGFQSSVVRRTSSRQHCGPKLPPRFCDGKRCRKARDRTITRSITRSSGDRRPKVRRSGGLARRRRGRTGTSDNRGPIPDPGHRHGCADTYKIRNRGGWHIAQTFEIARIHWLIRVQPQGRRPAVAGGESGADEYTRTSRRTNSRSRAAIDAGALRESMAARTDPNQATRDTATGVRIHTRSGIGGGGQRPELLRSPVFIGLSEYSRRAVNRRLPAANREPTSTRGPAGVRTPAAARPSTPGRCARAWRRGRTRTRRPGTPPRVCGSLQDPESGGVAHRRNF